MSSTVDYNVHPWGDVCVMNFAVRESLTKREAANRSCLPSIMPFTEHVILIVVPWSIGSVNLKARSGSAFELEFGLDA